MINKTFSENHKTQSLRMVSAYRNDRNVQQNIKYIYSLSSNNIHSFIHLVVMVVWNCGNLGSYNQDTLLK